MTVWEPGCASGPRRQSRRRDFDEIDTDKDGFVTAAERAVSLQTDPKVSDDNTAAIVKIADDGDRRIDFEEYAELVRWSPTHLPGEHPVTGRRSHRTAR
ncbi:EF-hand domain-containing protein [Streptomyces sp. NPDC097727]|uniref:EF-hand domain-containing protein n=1 Tax=Streptomyces sp. NPDC097727 TaxID=3366092 RepID=UPI00380FD4F5